MKRWSRDGRGRPTIDSQPSAPIATTHESRPFRSRAPTARTSFDRSASSCRTAVTAAGVRPAVTTRKIASRVGGSFKTYAVATGRGASIATS